MIGEILGNRYKILHDIGSGGMAWVYLAEDTQNRSLVAVKVLYPQFSEDMAYVQRFNREAKLASSLSDPHIVSVLDYGATRDIHYLVMEYIEGRDLKSILQERGVLPYQEVLEIARQVAQALEHANKHGIVHRDIKPQNLMLMADGTVKVLDFGIARAGALPSLTQSGFVGTPYYISPEQAIGEDVDVRSDIYSLGIVMYEMLSGDLPFDAESPWSIIRQHITSGPPSLRLKDDNLPEAVEQLVNKALAKRPDDRFQTAAELLAAIEAILASEEMPAEAGPSPPRPEHPLLRDLTQARELKKPSQAEVSFVGGFETAVRGWWERARAGVGRWKEGELLTKAQREMKRTSLARVSFVGRVETAVKGRWERAKAGVRRWKEGELLTKAPRELKRAFLARISFVGRVETAVKGRWERAKAGVRRWKEGELLARAPRELKRAFLARISFVGRVETAVKGRWERARAGVGRWKGELLTEAPRELKRAFLARISFVGRVETAVEGWWERARAGVGRWREVESMIARLWREGFVIVLVIVLALALLGGGAYVYWRYSQIGAEEALEASYQQGLAALAEGNWKGAIEEFDRLLAFAPGYKDVVGRKAEALARLYAEGEAYYQQDQWDEAIARLSEIYGIHPDYGGGRAAQQLYEAYLRRGDDHRERGELALALEDYEAALGVGVADRKEAQKRWKGLLGQLATPTAAATPLEEVTATAMPPEEATAMPPEEATATPLKEATVTATPPEWYPAPRLVAPADGAVFGAGERIILKWEAVGGLTKDEFYNVTVLHFYAGEEVYWGDATHETEIWFPPDGGYGKSDKDVFHWWVEVRRTTVIKPEGKPDGPAVSPKSEAWTFIWR